MIALLYIPFLIELLILIQLVRQIRYINIHITDLLFYYRDSHYNKKSENHIPSKLSDIENQLHNLFIEIKDK